MCDQRWNIKFNNFKQYVPNKGKEVLMNKALYKEAVKGLKDLVIDEKGKSSQSIRIDTPTSILGVRIIS